MMECGEESVVKWFNVRMMTAGLEAMDIRHLAISLLSNCSWEGQRMFLTMMGSSLVRMVVVSCSLMNEVQFGKIMVVLGEVVCNIGEL
jgi:hypothetical protein